MKNVGQNVFLALWKKLNIYITILFIMINELLKHNQTNFIDKRFKILCWGSHCWSNSLELALNTVNSIEHPLLKDVYLKP